ncbi:DUF1419 domain-containing protein [Mesorhizobium sp. B2-6-5]|uniref:DUF1419 domain-containing protein n=1 Tax=Mesorhizobium sp. B2-6-5 TaxID=2589912 RepID=UPI00112C9262|nr:DUF1419 domain-containing protein [Mesorhizobium sp. B2-6-5]TPJ38532.1 DUF1419 domain-containing protein [Mesorhizobium sp. B2-6-5]
MTAHPPFRKVLDGVATREQMFQLFSRHKDTLGIDLNSGTPYSGEWFEITASEYHFMLDLLPPLFMRTGMFGMSEYKAGNVTSVFFAIRIRGRERWFHGFCDLTDRQSPDKMRAAIIAHETGAGDSMTRAEKLEAIWTTTPVELRGTARNADPETGWAEHRGKRTILVNAGRQDAAFRLLNDLSDLEIDEFLSKVRLRRS